VRPYDTRLAFDAVDAHRHSSLVGRQADAPGVAADGDAFAHQDVSDRCRDVIVFVLDQTRFLLDDGDTRAEAPLHLSEFETHIRTAHDYQVLGHASSARIELLVRYGTVPTPGMSGTDSTPSDIDEDAGRTEKLLADSQSVWFLERALPFDDSAASDRAQPLLDVVS